MKSSSKLLLAVAGLLALIIVGFVLLRAPDVPDQTQITTQLETARAAAERHDVGGVMRIVSAHYHDANVPSPVQLRFLLGKVQGSDPVRVTLSPPTVAIQGDTAVSQCRLRVAAADGSRLVYDHDVTIHWAREDGTRFGVLPTKVWRAVSADYGSPFGDISL